MFNHVRPWLRFIEGTEGSQAGQGDTPDNTGAEPDQENTENRYSTEEGDGEAAKKLLDDYIRSSIDETSRAQRDEDKKGSEPAQESEKADTKPSQDSDINVDELKKQLAATQKTVEELQAWKAQGEAQERVALTTEIAKSLGLPEELAGRLQGDTREQLEEDAKELSRVLGSRHVDPTQGRSTSKQSGMTVSDAIAAKLEAAGLKVS